MASEIGKLSIPDFLKSAISAAIAAVIVALAGMVGTDFNVFTIDWATTGQLVINVGVGAFLGDIVRRFSSDKEGKLFGKI